jgi:tRNA G10  N-methylase Trm11
VELRVQPYLELVQSHKHLQQEIVKALRRHQPIQKQVQPNLEEILLTQNLIQKPKQEVIINNISLNNEVIRREPEKIKTTKKLLKKTIHKKYTLGKSNIKRTVAVLLKDNNTRKNIINAQKDLKGKSVNDVKTYLRNHNLIKIGSNAPNDVIRKIYESAMLAGEITNNNKDIMLHNFMKEDK